MKKDIKYIGFYNAPNSSKTERSGALSAINKMNYICDSLSKIGYKVSIISPSWIIDDTKSASFEKGYVNNIDSNKKIIFFPSYHSSIKVLNKFKIFLSLGYLMFYLLFKTKTKEKVLVYHSPWLALPLLIAKKIKKLEIVLEVEEIYNKVWNLNKILTNWENLLFNISDSYVVVTNDLANLLPNKNKILLYGVYKIENNKTDLKFKDNKKHVVFAGAIEETRGGAFQFVECIPYLKENIVLHILGYGNEEDINKLLERIKLMNKQAQREVCIYEGVKKGIEFSNFLHVCDIGVNPQYVGDYMSGAFPSKILTYLCHNLLVISTPIESIQNSPFNRNISFTKNDNPECIAEVINESIYLNKPNNTDIIKKLDEEFIKNLETILKK